MNSFYVRWRSVRQHREFELYAPETIAPAVLAAVESGHGMSIWSSGTVWRCPGCGDRTIRTEEFLEGLRRAEIWLNDVDSHRGEGRVTTGITPNPTRGFEASEWIAKLSAMMLGCERDRVYIKDDDGLCTFGTASYVSRI